MAPANPEPLPDPDRVAACCAAPENGPRIVIFGGGSALRGTSGRLVQRTHNTAHFLTPFDSGGSSAELRRKLGLPSVGDLRNRLLALADRNQAGVQETRRMLGHRLPPSGDPEALRAELEGLCGCRHPLQEAAPVKAAARVAEALRLVRDQLPSDFDLRGASIGNLVLAGDTLAEAGGLDEAIDAMARLLHSRGEVHPASLARAHLRAELRDGRSISGQHLLTGKEVPALECGIERITLVDQLPDGAPVVATAHPAVGEQLERAELVCLPMGSFWTSLMASILPKGVGSGLSAARCPKVFVPSTGEDPELQGMDIADCVAALQQRVAEDGGEPGRALTAVLVDADGGDYQGRLDVDRVRGHGAEVWQTGLISRKDPTRLDAGLLADALISLAR